MRLQQAPRSEDATIQRFFLFRASLRARPLTAPSRPLRRPLCVPALLAATFALLASPAAAAVAAPHRAINASATPSWLAVGPSAAAGSFDLFNLNSQGQKTKVLVTFPVDAAEVAQDGAFGCGRGYCMMLTQLPATKQTVLRNFSFFAPALLGKYVLPFLAYNLNVNEAEADDDFYGEARQSDARTQCGRDAGAARTSDADATQRDAARRSATQRDAARRNATQRDATRRNATQRDAARRSATQRDSTRRYMTLYDAI